MKFGLIIILLSMYFAQNISFYNKDNESYSDVKTKEFTFTCRVGGMGIKVLSIPYLCIEAQ